MALKSYKPVTPSSRQMTGYTFEEITKDKPERALVLAKQKRHAGRNFRGKITVRHRGGGSKRKLRIIDFKRDKTGVPGKVVAIEYDPNRTARLALLHYTDGDKRYILAPLGLNPGDMVLSGPGAEIRPGCALPMKSIPTGSRIHNIEMYRGKGGQIVRADRKSTV